MDDGEPKLTAGMRGGGKSDMLRMAQLQTVLDAVQLLLYLRNEGSSVHHAQIDTMTKRLTNMAGTL